MTPLPSIQVSALMASVRELLAEMDRRCEQVRECDGCCAPCEAIRRRALLALGYDPKAPGGLPR